MAGEIGGIGGGRWGFVECDGQLDGMGGLYVGGIGGR